MITLLYLSFIHLEFNMHWHLQYALAIANSILLTATTIQYLSFRNNKDFAVKKKIFWHEICRILRGCQKRGCREVILSKV